MDEDLPREIADLLTVAGHDPVTVVGQGRQGLSDDELWPRVQNEQRWLLTADKEFADSWQHPPGIHAGVMLLRSPEESRRLYRTLSASRTAAQTR